MTRRSENVLVTLPVLTAHRARLEAAMPGAAFTYKLANTVRAGDVRDRTIIMGNITPALLRNANALRWLQLESAGADAYTIPGAMPPEVMLTCSTGAYGHAVAEHAFAMYAALSKKLPLYRDAQSRRTWADRGDVRGLFGNTVLIAGFGNIGQTFARLMRPLDSYILGIGRCARNDGLADELYETLDALDALLPRADIALFCLPGTEATRHAMNGPRLARMKPTAILLNVGRGIVIDTEALCDAVESGRLFAAGLDVVDPEPLPSGHRLWGIENIQMTPHISGGYHLADTLNRIVDIWAENLSSYRDARPMRSVIDRSLGYAVPESTR
ncbi:MAG: D-2-hydroxyacid dehydrogenase [Clostridia bacterium]|nr:D-2-hydroxyacid dehydrogenase [Clostridia bacterium]